MESEIHTFEDISVGAKASFEKTWLEADLDTFAKLSGDFNPLHMNEDFAKESQFGKRVVHGMLVASSLSKLVGMHLPGRDCLYLKQTISFKKPVFIGDTLNIEGTVTSKSEATRILDITVKILRGSDVVVEGETKVQVLKNTHDK